MPKTFVLLSSMVFGEAWFTALKSRGFLRSFGRLVRSSFSDTNSVEAKLPLYYFGNGNQTKSLFFRHFSCASSPVNSMLVKGLSTFGHHGAVHRGYAKDAINASVELKTDSDVIRFRIGDECGEHRYLKKTNKTTRQARISRKAKLNELRFYRLKAQKKMKSPNPEVRIRYKLEKAKRKEAWLIEKLRKYELPKAPPETYDPEILTEEEKFYLKRTGEKKKHYVPVGRRGVFGGVVLNMHLHWKKHETVKVVCKPCRPGQIHTYADELARLSKGTIIDIKPNNIIIFYRGKNYVQPDVMSPPETLSKAKALEKYRYEQSLDHTSQFIEKLEKELEEYHEHLARFRKEKSVTCKLQERDVEKNSLEESSRR